MHKFAANPILFSSNDNNNETTCKLLKRIRKKHN